MKNKNVLYCYLATKNGYGVSADSLINVLSRIKGVDVDLLPINKPNIQQEMKLKEQYDVLIMHISPGSVLQDIQQNGYLKMVMSRCRKRYQYLLWETDRLPRPFIDLLVHPEWMTGVICPSHFIEGLCGPLAAHKKEVHYIPITTDDTEYNPDQKINRNGKFTVLTVAQVSVRKAIDISVCAFVTAFAGLSDVEYYIKIGERLDNTDVESMIRANVVRSMIGNPPPIYTVDRLLADHEMRDLYLGSDCYLHLSRGEGFGMTPLSAINYGLPVVYTDWSAHSEFLNKDKNSFPVEVRLDLVHSMDTRYGFEPGMKWAETNIASAATALRKAYEKWKKGKFLYEVPEVVNEYKQEAVIAHAAKFLEIENPEIKSTTIEGVKVEEL